VTWALASTAAAVDELEAVRRAWISRDYATPEAWRRGELAGLPADAMARLRAWDADRAGAAHAACAARYPEALAGQHAGAVLIGVLDYYMQQIHGLAFAELFYDDDLIPSKLARTIRAHKRSAVADAPPLIVRHRASWYLVNGGRAPAGALPSAYSSGPECIAAWLSGIKGGRVLGVDVSQTLCSIFDCTH
jgi:hypothetical protein